MRKDTRESVEKLLCDINPIEIDKHVLEGDIRLWLMKWKSSVQMVLIVDAIGEEYELRS